VLGIKADRHGLARNSPRGLRPNFLLRGAGESRHLTKEAIKGNAGIADPDHAKGKARRQQTCTRRPIHHWILANVMK
jgi:hypothetical protein